MGIADTYKTLVDVYLKPKKTFKTTKKASFSEGLLAVVLGSLVPAIILAVSILVGSSFFIGIPLLGPMLGFAGAALALGVLILLPIGAIISWLIAGIIYWIIGAIVGGKSNLGDFLASYGFLAGALLLLTWIPAINIIVGLYSIYLLYELYKQIMKMDSNKAAVAVVIILVLGIFLTFVAGAITSTMTGIGAISALIKTLFF